MPGLLVHLIVALLCLFVVHLLHFRWEFSLSIFVGNFIPDAVKFIGTALQQGTWAIFHVEQNGFYHFLDRLSGSLTNWFSLGFFFLGTALLLWHFHYIQRKKMEEYDELYVFFLLGILIHLLLDALFIEQGIWY